MDLHRIQQTLRETGIDAWLFYDYHRRDPIAYRVLGFRPHGMATRRWYYVVPAEGAPVKLVHRIESFQLDSLPGETRTYASWQEHAKMLEAALAPHRVLAMQYSPMNGVPAMSMVDAGTIELIRSLGKEIVSSADLVQQFEAVWSPEALASHMEAAKAIDGIVDDAFREIALRIEADGSTDEHSIQCFIIDRLAERGLTSNRMRPIVAVNRNSGNPHYHPTRERCDRIQRGDFVLLDVWGKMARLGAVFYDITWTGWVPGDADRPPAAIQKVFMIVKAARDAAIETVQNAMRAGRELRGWEVDRAARSVIESAGYGEFFLHRTGHSIGEDVHGNGANMDDLEARDDRRVIPGTCFSIEPGIYLPEFGVRSEIDLYVEERDARVTGRMQEEIVRIER